MSFFFFKHKTAYEMRISDWSSDVCSSDLRQCHIVRARVARLSRRAAGAGGGSGGRGRVQRYLGELRVDAALDDQAGRPSQRIAADDILASVGVAALADGENAGRTQRDGRCRIGVDQYPGGASRSVSTVLRLEETGVGLER